MLYTHKDMFNDDKAGEVLMQWLYMYKGKLKIKHNSDDYIFYHYISFLSILEG